jgi:predicted type IV restriction endonuclease
MDDAPLTPTVQVVTNDETPALAEASSKKTPTPSMPKWETAARVKRVNTKLAGKHLRQVEMYAVNEGVEWVILTSGVNWQVYHITGGLPVLVDLALEVDLLGESPQTKANKLYYLTKESLRRHQIDELWQAKRATSPKSLAKVLCSDAVASVIRKELKRTTGQNVSTADVVQLLKETVLKPECFGTK